MLQTGKKTIYYSETKTVTLKIEAAEPAFCKGAKSQPVLEPGAFKLLLGFSSRDIRVEGIMTIDGGGTCSVRRIKKGALASSAPFY